MHCTLQLNSWTVHWAALKDALKVGYWTNRECWRWWRWAVVGGHGSCLLNKWCIIKWLRVPSTSSLYFALWTLGILCHHRQCLNLFVLPIWRGIATAAAAAVAASFYRIHKQFLIYTWSTKLAAVYFWVHVLPPPKAKAKAILLSAHFALCDDIQIGQFAATAPKLDAPWVTKSNVHES